jgi:dienelactone hydrolase
VTECIKRTCAAAVDAVSTLGIFLAIIALFVFFAGQAVAQDGALSLIATGSAGPKLIQEEVRIPVPGNGYSVAATILRPEGPGPFGAVVLNHGVPGSARERRKESAAADFNASAPVFARRGYVVVMPLRRGFGATGGEFAEDAGPCRNPDYMRAEAAAAQDVMAAYEYARSLSYVDGKRMILAGQSAGGIVSMFAAGTRKPQGLVAVLAFAAGRGGNPTLRPGLPCAVEPVAKVLDTIGAQVKVPVLLHYAQNDKYFGPATTRLWYERFTAAGAQAEYVMQPAFGKDGHYLFGDIVGVRYWLPAVEGFLAKHGVPFERLQAPAKPLLAKLPMEQSDSCESLYRAFLEAPEPRAYAVSGDGRCGFAGNTPDATDVALSECRSVSGAACALYAVDSEVVWKSDTQPTMTASKPGAASATTGSR